MCTGWQVRIGGLHSVTPPVQPRLAYKRVDPKTVKHNQAALCDVVTIRWLVRASGSAFRWTATTASSSTTSL